MRFLLREFIKVLIVFLAQKVNNSLYILMELLTFCAKVTKCRLQIALDPLQKQAYSNIWNISPPKIESFQIKKNSDIFSYFFSKHKLWILIRTVSARRF